MTLGYDMPAFPEGPSEPERIAALEAELARARDSERLLRSLLDAAPDFIVETSAGGIIQFVNRVAPGLLAEQVVGSNITEFLEPEYHEVALRAVAEAVETGATASFDSRGTGAHGELRHYHSRVARVAHEGREATALMIASDVSELRSTHLKLAESEEKLELAVEASEIGTWSWERPRDAVQWDSRTFAIFGVSPAEAPSTVDGYLSRVHPDDRERVTRAVERAVETGVYDDLEHRILVRDEVRWVICRGRASRGPSGSVDRLVGAILDITERRMAQEQRLTSQKLEAVGQLAAGIAHNFNNMLAAILPNLELAQRRAPVGAHSHIEAARTAAERAGRMVRQLVLFAGGGHRSERRPESIHEVVARTIDMATATLEPSLKVALSVSQRPAVAQVDAGQLEQVILNMLLNARDAYEPGQGGVVRVSVHVEADADGEQVVITLADDGSGMSDEVRRRVFEPFFTTKSVGKGTGLGLATSYAIIRDHAGSIECESSPGEGTTFVIRLPSSTEEPPQVTRVSPRASARGSERVLVVDDEEMVRRVVADILQHAGYEVASAGNGHEALDALRKSGFALLILDLRMPGIGGEEVIVQARKLSPATRVVCFSGTDSDVEGVDAMLTKPVGAEELLETVREVLDR